MGKSFYVRDQETGATAFMEPADGPGFAIDAHTGKPLTIAVAAASGSTISEVEVDVGPIPQPEASFTVTDPAVTASSIVMATLSGAQPTGKDADEVEMDSFAVTCQPSAGQLRIVVKGLEGFIHDKFKVTYMVGT